MAASRGGLALGAPDLPYRPPGWAVRLTPQGAAVVAQLGDVLRGRRPIRWPRVRAALLAALQTPEQTLWARFRAALDDTERRLRKGGLELSELYQRGFGTEVLRQHLLEDLARAQRLALVLAALDAAPGGC
jgi:hypothetical protein